MPGGGYTGRTPPPAVTSGDINQFQEIYNYAQGNLANTTADTITADALVTVLGVTATAIGISLIPLESNFGGPLAAALISDAMAPLMDRAIKQPIDAFLRQYLRFRGLSPSMVVRMFDEGIISSSDIAVLAVYDDIADPFIPLLQAYANAKKQQAALVTQQKIQEAADTFLLFQYQEILSRLNTQVSSLENEVATLDVDYYKLQADAQISLLNGLANSLDNYANHLDFGATDTETAHAQTRLVNLIPYAQQVIASGGITG